MYDYCLRSRDIDVPLCQCTSKFARPNTDEESEAFLHARGSVDVCADLPQLSAKLIARAGYQHLLAPASETSDMLTCNNARTIVA